MTEAEFLEKFHITLDEEQRAAMRIAGRHALLLAVPGSGKTHPNFRIPENRPDVNAPFTAGIV